MKILVTGGAGFIGSNVVDEFVRQGWDTVVVDDLSSGNRRNLNPNARLYQLDIRDDKLAEVFEQEKPDIVSHHAAQISVRRSVEDPFRDAMINVLGSLNVIANCAKYGVRKLLYASSGGAVYGEPVYLPCDEKHPVDPLCPYGLTKHTPEHYLFMYRQLYGLDYTVLRYPNVYGPRQDPFGEAGVVAIFTEQMLRGDQVVINGTGEQERDFVYVADIVRSNILSINAGSGGIYNIGSGIGTSVNQIFDELRQITGYARRPVFGPPKAGETFRIYLDATKAAEELGWRPETALRDGLVRTVDYFRGLGTERR
ncbi:MAG: NAD-dependent epimerase/dehydratase family protein [Chloroflexota bacterium]